jgi:hypothetical protein
VNTIDLLFETPTDQRNGVKVIVPVKYTDRDDFLDKIKNQLAYFENVYFDVNVNNRIITNEFQILRSEHFQISEMNTDSYMHICLDNVYYPLDFIKLGIRAISFPVGLKFGLSDGLFPTPNREQIIYSNQAKKAILEKIEKVADYFVEKYNENSIECKDIHEIFRYYSNNSRIVNIGTLKYDANLLNGYTSKKFIVPTYSNYTHINFKTLYDNRNYMFNEYRIGIQYVRGQFRHTSATYNSTIGYEDLQRKRIFIYDDAFAGNKKSYIKSLLPPNDYNSIYFVKKYRKFTLRVKSRNHTYDNYYNLLGLHKVPKENWRAVIKEFQAIIAEFTSTFIDVDKTVIPQSWLDAKKKAKVFIGKSGTRRVKLQGEINVKVAEELQRYVHEKNSKLTPTVLKVENIPSTKLLLVYGREKDSVTIDHLYSISKNQKIKYFVLSEKEYKVAESLDIHNLMSIEKFMEGKNKPFKRLVTSYLIDKLIKEFPSAFVRQEVINLVSKSLYDKLHLLETYKKDNYNSYCDERIYKSMIEVAEDKNLFDETIYTEYKQVRKFLTDNPYVNTTLEIMPTFPVADLPERGKAYVKILTDLFKYHKQRMDYTNYSFVTLNEDKVEDITEETLSKLEDNI